MSGKRRGRGQKAAEASGSRSLDDTLEDEVMDIDIALSQTQPNRSEYNEGAVIRLKLINFMTYKFIELDAGPYLNLVLGPNGTGKSAIVCGIIIGLAGDASATGRSGSLGEYIKFGCECAVVEVELFNPNGNNHIIERKILTISGHKSKSEYRSEWKLNGRKSKQSDVRGYISRLNIRVDNLCQFLPQERVVEFVRMDNKELLENTEKAAGDVSMFEDHEKLQNISRDLKVFEGRKSNIALQLDSETQFNQRLEEEVQRVKERESFEEKIKWLEMKKPWLEFEKVRIEYKETQDKVRDMEAELKNNQKKHEPLRKELEKTAQVVKSQESECKTLEAEMRAAANMIKVRVQSAEVLCNKTAEVKEDFETKKQQEENRKKQVEEYRAEIMVLKQQLENLSENQDLDPQIESCEHKIVAVRETIKDVDEERSEVRDHRDRESLDLEAHKKVMSQLQDTFNQKLDLLRRFNPDAYTAAAWLKGNQSKFRQKIYPPIMTQINVKKREWAKQLENAISGRDMSAFVCENVEDLKLFADSVQREKGVKVAVVMAPDRDPASFTPQISITELKHYGFQAYLSEMFTAPDAVTAYLCNHHHLHDIPFGGAKVRDNVQQICDETQLRRFFSDESKHQIQLSRYDNKSIVTNSRLQEPRNLKITLDQAKLKETEKSIARCKRLMEEYDKTLLDLNRKESIARDEWTALKQEKKELNQKKDERKTLNAKIAAKEEAIHRKSREVIDLEAEKKRLIRILGELNVQKVKARDNLVEAIKSCSHVCGRKMIANLNVIMSREMKGWFEERLHRANAEFKQLEQQVQVLKEQRDVKKREAQSKRKLAERATNTEGNKPLPSPVKVQFEALPDSLVEVEAQLRDLYLRMSTIGENTDPSVIRDYDERKRAIEKKKDEMNKIQATVEQTKKQLQIIKARWLPPLLELLNRINANFSRFMAKLDCAGEVSLKRGDDEDEFDKYGIGIKVKYRDSEQLEELSAFHQSGGERSVATMVYMIALQELTKVPFRCVDEINQGMDSNNERRVFDLIVQTATDNSSQYFLFSPKLLMDLTFTEKMKIHVISNGPQMRLNWKQNMSQAPDHSH